MTKGGEGCGNCSEGGGGQFSVTGGSSWGDGGGSTGGGGGGISGGGGGGIAGGGGGGHSGGGGYVTGGGGTGVGMQAGVHLTSDPGCSQLAGAMQKMVATIRTTLASLCSNILRRCEGSFALSPATFSLQTLMILENM